MNGADSPMSPIETPSPFVEGPIELVFNEPKLYSTLPEELVDHPQLTFDEFDSHAEVIKVQRLNSRVKDPRDCHIKDACRSMYKAYEKRTESNSYGFSLAEDETLDFSFKCPGIVQQKDLFTKFWPSNRHSVHLKSRTKMFHGYNRDYESFPTVAYGGMSEWLYILSGRLEVSVWKPTFINTAKYSALLGGEEFKGESNTCDTFFLDPENFMTIPAGCITVRRAVLDTFALTGEYLHCHDFTGQLESFQRDVRNTNARYCVDRDIELRSLYWFTAANLGDCDGGWTAPSLQSNDLDFFGKTLRKWREMHKTHEYPAQLWAPFGLDLDTILDNFPHLIYQAAGTSIEEDSSASAPQESLDQSHVNAKQQSLSKQKQETTQDEKPLASI